MPQKFKLVVLKCHKSAAVLFSRSSAPADEEKRGFIQHDYSMTVTAGNHVTHINRQPICLDATYMVALPRNLLVGFCNIQPLVEWAKQNPEALPDEGIFHPAFQVSVFVLLY